MAAISDYLHKKASLNKIPLSGTFELSPICNFSCKMCYVRKTQEQLNREGKKLIPWEKWLQLAEECKEAGMLYLLLTGGEPFIYPGFKELYMKLHQMGFVLSINSNGMMIDEATVEWLKMYAPHRINITLYGNSPETYGKICGNRAAYERVVRAIIMLKEAGIPVVVNASMIPENVDDLEAIFDFGQKYDLNIRMGTYMFPPVRRDVEADDSRFDAKEAAAVYIRKQKKLYSAEQYEMFLEKMVKKVESCASKEMDEPMAGPMSCRAGRSSFWISWEGIMTACGMLDFPLKVYPFQKRFQECWQELTDTVRKAEVLRGCHNCAKKEICKPCVAMIYGETGTINEKAPYLCEMTDCIYGVLSKELEVIRDEKKNTI